MKFTNPYNFVPFEGKCVRTELQLGGEECLTGYFECALVLLTPLFVPNTSCSFALCSPEERANEFTGYEFCSYENLADSSGEMGENRKPPLYPVIPGSEIRGTVRSVYEAAFNGCMSTISADRTLGRRNPRSKKPGILRKEGDGRWELIPCKRAMLYVDREGIGYNQETFGERMPQERYQSLQEGERIWFKKSEKGYPKNGRQLNKVVEAFKIPDKDGNQNCPKDYSEGWLHKGEQFGTKKHHESVFYMETSDKAKRIEVANEDVELLKQLVMDYHGSKKKFHSEYGLETNQVLVYYTDEENLPLYLSPACIGKEMYRKSLEKLLEHGGDYQPCCSRTALCPACRVFGMVSGKKGQKDALGSRVRFTDAVLDQPVPADRVKEFYCKPTVLPEAGEPRVSAVEFYTLPPYGDHIKKTGWDNEGYWTYDYVCVNEKGAGNGKDKVIRKPLPKDLPELRGRKFYWHSENWKSMRGKELKNVMQQRIRPICKSDPETGERIFRFRVYFNRLNRGELERLRWALDFEDPHCAHKIGRGKPLGYGSARIQIEGLKMQELNHETGEIKLSSAELERSESLPSPQRNEAMKTLKTMTDWKNRPQKISYPTKSEALDGSKAYEWFAENSKNSKDKWQPAFSRILPKPCEELAGTGGDNRLDTKAGL